MSDDSKHAIQGNISDWKIGEIGQEIDFRSLKGMLCQSSQYFDGSEIVVGVISGELLNCLQGLMAVNKTTGGWSYLWGICSRVSWRSADLSVYWTLYPKILCHISEQDDIANKKYRNHSLPAMLMLQRRNCLYGKELNSFSWILYPS